MTTLDDLVAQLPHVTERPDLQPGPLAVSYVDDPNPSFVAPPLTLEHPIVPQETSLVLISAAAAVGKSTLASEIALRTGAPLWNLGQFSVGDNFVAGTVVKSYGAARAASVFGGLSGGSFLLVLDALDEAELRAGDNGFEAFIRDLCELARDPRPSPVFVVLARAETAELLSLHLEDATVPFARCSVEFFDEASAQEFIRLRLDEANRSGHARVPHREHASAFDDVMDATFTNITRALDVSRSEPWEDTKVRTFLGYAPVLVAISTF